MNWLFIFVLLCILVFGFVGYHRGLIKSVFSTVATILALVLSYALTPMVGNWLMKTSLAESFENKVYTYMQEKVQETRGASKEKASQLMEKNPAKQDQISLIKDLPIPDFVEDMLLSNNNSDGYKALGVDTVYRYVAKSAARVAVNIVAGILTFIVVRLLLLVIVIAVSSVVRHFKILAVVDRIGGAVAGLALGVIIVWVVMFVTSLVMDGDSYTNLLKQNGFLKFLNDHNVLMSISLRK